jgi:hypothetical protein
VLGGAATGILSGAVLAQSGSLVNAWQSRTLLKLPTDDGRVLKLKNIDLLGTRLRPPDETDGFRLAVRKGKKTEWFEGPEAERMAAVILPKMNRQGGKARTVQEAVSEIEQLGHPDAFLADVITGDRFKDKKGVPGYINKMPTPTKLALEMALHEEQERRALEGELKGLEAAWAAAEEIAAIADDLLLPEGAAEFLAQNRPTAE